MPGSWWPKVTEDVVLGDLQFFRKLSHRRSSATTTATAKGQEGGVETVDAPEWTLVDPIVDEPLEKKTTGDGSIGVKWNTLTTTVETAKQRLSRMAYDLCMSQFHAWALVGSSELHGSHKSPLSVCQSMDTPSLAATTSTAPMSSKEDFIQFVSKFGVSIFSIKADILSHIAEHTDRHRLALASPNHQDSKDIQRDVVILNGKRLSGADIGYEGILKRVDEALAKAGDTVKDDGESLGAKVLSIAGRTFSGGIAFSHVLSQFSHEGISFVAPVSTEADPLDIIIHPTLQHALIRAHTRYAIHLADEGEGSGDETESQSVLVDACLVAEIPLGHGKGEVDGYIFLARA